jgi:hypothetical protein
MDDDLFSYRPPNHGELYEEWLAFHKANPRVYELICMYCDQVLARGERTYAIATIWERLRWHFTVETRSEVDFKLPNNHRAYYARFWMKEHPQHGDFFRTATLRSVTPKRTDRYGRDLDDEEC